MRNRATARCEKTLTLKYDPEQFQRWMRGDLREEWFRRYKRSIPCLCGLDFSNARGQRHGHFGEWYTAIYYLQKGWKVLLPKYTHATRVKRRVKTRRLIGENNFDFLMQTRELPNKRGSGAVLRKPPKPDLLVYKSPDEYFFAEVKRDGDRLSKAQVAFFRMIERKLGCRVQIVHVTENNGEIIL